MPVQYEASGAVLAVRRTYDLVNGWGSCLKSAAWVWEPAFCVLTPCEPSAAARCARDAKRSATTTSGSVLGENGIDPEINRLTRCR